MTQYILILFYIGLLTFFIYKCKFFAFSHIAKPVLLLLFLIKVMAAFFYIFTMNNFVNAGDIFNYYNDSLIVFDYLKHGNVLTYLHLTFGLNNTTITPDIAQAVEVMGYWEDTSAYMQVRFNAVFNMFTWGKSIYANAIFFSFFSYSAAIIILKFFQIFLLQQSKLLAFTVFFTPSILFWTSGMHKETLSIFFMAAIVYTFFNFIKFKQLKFVVIVFVSLVFLFFLRYFVAALLLPPLLAYVLFSFHKKYAPAVYFVVVYFLSTIGLYVMPLVFNKPNIIDLINNKKELYLALKKGNTAIDLGEYDLSYLGYIMKVPQAIINTSIRPFITESNTIFLQLASFESLFISIIVLLSLFFLHKLSQRKRAIAYIFYSFSLTYLILAGLIVPNIGAILRYRSVALFFLVPISVFVLSIFLSSTKK